MSSTIHESTIGNNSVLTGVLNRLLAPLARLCLANGITFAAAEDALKQAFVQEANALQPGAPEHGMVSRISTATGISRREVTRLTKIKAPARPVKPPLSAELFARWMTGSDWQEQDGTPRVLNRQGAAPSFEALAQTITRDIHPRSMLDELVRLGIVNHDEASDRVSLTRCDFVPRSDSRQMLGMLGNNVGDHLNAAVANVLSDSGKHLEQAVFADELSAESIEALRPLVTSHWESLRDAMVPVITTMIENDQIAGRVQDQRVHIGLYSFSETTSNNEVHTNEANGKSTSKEGTK